MFRPFKTVTKNLISLAPHNCSSNKLHSSKKFLPFAIRQFHATTVTNFARPAVAKPRAITTTLTSTVHRDDPLSHEVYRYDIDFRAKCKDIQWAQEGAYLELTDAEMERYLPEGGAGEMKEEMKVTQKNAFMIRNSSKLVCRILDDFAHQIKYGTPAPIPPTGVRYPVELHDWTDGREWDNSHLQVFSHGSKNLVRVKDPKVRAMKLVRGPGSVVEDTLEAIKEKNNQTIPNNIILTGERGSGKSGCLTHAVYHARKNGWIVVFLPRGYDHVNGGPFIEPVSEVTGIPDLYDNPMLSAASLRDLWRAHHRELSGIPIKEKSRIDKYREVLALYKDEAKKNQEDTENKQTTFTGLRSVVAGEEDTFPDEDLLDSPILNSKFFDIFKFEINTLADMCLAGIAFREFAGPAFIDVVEELRNYNNPNFPILIAVDQVNFWDMKTVYKYENKPISATQICVPYATKFLSHKKSENNKSMGSNVFCIGATTNYYPISKKELVTYIDTRSSLPLSIHIPCYSHVEFLAACKIYLNTKVIDHGISNQDLLSFRSHVSNNPRLARKDATRFFMPIYSKIATAAFVLYTRGEDMEGIEEFHEDYKNGCEHYGLADGQAEVELEEEKEKENEMNGPEETDSEDENRPPHAETSKYALNREGLKYLPEAAKEVDVDLTNASMEEREAYYKMIIEGEEVDDCVPSHLPLREKVIKGKDAKKMSRENDSLEDH